MHEPDHVDSDQYGQERDPRDRDVSSGGELERVSVDGWSVVGVGRACIVLVVPVVARQLARWRGRLDRCPRRLGTAGHADKLGHVRQRKVVQRQICPTPQRH